MRINLPLLLLFIICMLGVANAQTPITFNTKTDFTTGTSPQSVSIGDINGDGKPDLAVVNGINNSVSVLLNTTTPGAAVPTFSAKTDFSTASSPNSVSISDFNGDGKLDLVVTNKNSNSVSIFLNTTTPGATIPTFTVKTDFTTGTNPSFVSIGDLNADGKPDLTVSNFFSQSISVFFNTTTPGAAVPTFSAKTDFVTASSPNSVSISDFNGDGKPDIAVPNFNSKSVSVFFNTTALGAAVPTFSAKADFTAEAFPISIFTSDLNGDGKPDIVVSNRDGNSVSVFFNTTPLGAAMPTFSSKTDFATGNSPRAVYIGDLNGDGKPDLAVANRSGNNVSVLLNTTIPGAAIPTFSTKTDFVTGSFPNSVSFRDLNGDSKPDFVSANVGSNSISVFLNTTILGVATPSFSSKTDFTTGNNPQSVSIGDLNGDGKQDLAVVNRSSNSVSVFFNTTAPGAAVPTFSAKKDFTTASSPRSVSIGDLNADGKLDLVVTNGSSNSVSVFINTAPPGAAVPSFFNKVDFTTGSVPTSVSIGDLNGDGKPDLAVSNFSSDNVSVLLSTTAIGVFPPSFLVKTDFVAGAGPLSVFIRDLNGDGKPDLTVTNFSSDNVSVLLSTTMPGAFAPTFSAKIDFITGADPYYVTIRDMNGNGKPDLVVVNRGPDNTSVFLNTTIPGAVIPTFSTKTDFTTGVDPYSVSICDMNGDFIPDFAVANNGPNSASVFLNTTTPGAATPTFSSKADFNTGSDPRSVSIGDLNGDGKPDLVAANYFSHSISVLLNTTILTGIEEVKNFIPTDFTLKQNYPNPFNPSTNISFSILGESFVTLKIYDILGSEVTQLVNRQLKTGSYNFSFDGANLTSGVYFYRLTAKSGSGNFIETKKMILLK